MKIMFPDYNACTVNLACSILKEFEAPYEHPTLGLCDELLKKDYKNIVVLLLDGMGTAILEHNLDENGFFRRNLRGSYSSVFPPTTVAATTSIASGLHPCQHGWLGWDCYYKEIDKNVTVFLNRETGTKNQLPWPSAAWTYRPYVKLVDKIENAGYQAYEASPFEPPHPATFPEICARIQTLCSLEGKKYIYAYWTEPDHTMHKKGCYCGETKTLLRELETQTQKLCQKLTDTLVLITADHGHMDSRGAALEDYPRLMDCLLRLPSIEPRAVNFFIKPGCGQTFEALFSQYFGKDFRLLTKDEVKSRHFFGPGPEHPRFDDMLGDYLAVAVSDLALFLTAEERDSFIGVHAGLTEDEMLVPLIGVERTSS